MLKVLFTKKFKKDISRIKKQRKDIKKLIEVMEKLTNDISLPRKNRNHKLKGNFVDRWDCHINPDCLLIYKKMKSEIRFERTGSHAELFK